MTLAIAFKSTEGIVLAADSRVTMFSEQLIPGTDKILVTADTWDNATKLLKFAGHDYVGAVFYGMATIGLNAPRTVSSLLTEFEATLPSTRLTVLEFAKNLGEFFLDYIKSNHPFEAITEPLSLYVGGYDLDGPHGKIYNLSLPQSPSPVEQLPDNFGIMWGGQKEIANRIMAGWDEPLFNLLIQKYNMKSEEVVSLSNEIRAVSGLSLPFQLLPLQDCLDLSILLIRTTIELTRFKTGLRGVGGAVDAAIITRREGFKYVQCKQIKGE